jgi:LPS sulfotransferase NodH
MTTRDRLAATGKRFYCVCFSVRSGSSLLCEDLTQWGVGEPTEYFQLPDQTIVPGQMADHLVALANAAEGEYFGFKVTWEQVHALTSTLRLEGDRSVGRDLRSVFPDLAFVYIERRDKVRQAVSAWRAETSGTWHWPIGSDVERGRPEYDFEQIRFHLQKAVGEDWLWSFHFQELGIRPTTVRYEDYVSDREHQLARIAKSVGWDGSAVPLDERLRVMRDDWTEEIARRFRADLYALALPMSDRPSVTPLPPKRSSFQGVGMPIAVAFGVAALDAALPQAILAPLLIAAPVLAGFRSSPRGVILVGLVAALLVLPLGFADNIQDTFEQLWIIVAIVLAGAGAFRVSRRRLRPAY